MSDIRFMAVLFLWAITTLVLVNIIISMLKQIPEEVAQVVQDGRVEEIYPCTLLINYIYSAECFQMAYDFSQYEKKGIIGLTISDQTTKEEAAAKVYQRLGNLHDLKNEDELEIFSSIYAALDEGTVIPNSYVYKTKGGDYIRL